MLCCTLQVRFPSAERHQVIPVTIECTTRHIGSPGRNPSRRRTSSGCYEDTSDGLRTNFGRICDGLCATGVADRRDRHAAPASPASHVDTHRTAIAVRRFVRLLPPAGLRFVALCRSRSAPGCAADREPLPQQAYRRKKLMRSWPRLHALARACSVSHGRGRTLHAAVCSGRV
jgi:hypothetical protein